ncbi:MAG: hypothetical protein NC230_06380 [Bacteroides sp.]|nr:hypothetical protein [Bacteroides sp.]MCM1414277.1 hypothetical protein [Bacteroides sp.]
MKKWILIIALVLFALTDITAQKTTRRKLKSKTGTEVSAASIKTIADTLIGDDCAIARLSGYDKPLRSNNESIFVTNTGEKRITALTLNIEYIDQSGRMLHSRKLTINCDIPSGETRMLTFKSWDKQHSFVYLRSTKPKRSDHTVYDIRCKVEQIVRQDGEPD